MRPGSESRGMVVSALCNQVEDDRIGLGDPGLGIVGVDDEVHLDKPLRHPLEDHAAVQTLFEALSPLEEAPSAEG